MFCIFCKNQDTEVIETRISDDGATVRRRRVCLKCEKRFTTYEKIEKSELYVVKKDKKREKFDRIKLEKGIERAFEKRPIPQERIQKMINEIEEQVRKRGNKEIKSSLIGDLVSKKIKKIPNL